MREGLSKIAVMLLAGMLFIPQVGREYVQCADGTPCSRMLVAGHGCCGQQSHEQHSRCIVRVVSPSPVDSQRFSTASIDLLPLAIVPIVTHPQPIQSPQRIVIRDDIPPPRPSPKQGNSPRSPPSNA